MTYSYRLYVYLVLAVLLTISFSTIAFADDEEISSYRGCVAAGGTVTEETSTTTIGRRSLSRCTHGDETFTLPKGMTGVGNEKWFKGRDGGIFGSSTGSTTAKELRDDRREELKERFVKRLSERLQMILENIHDRLENAILRLERSAERIGNFIERFEDSHGVELTEAKEHLENGIELTEEADQALASTTAYLADILDDDNATSTLKDHRTDLIEMYRAVRDLIKDAHRELVNAIVDIRASIGEGEDDESDGATTTDED